MSAVGGTQEAEDSTAIVVAVDGYGFKIQYIDQIRRPDLCSKYKWFRKSDIDTPVSEGDILRIAFVPEKDDRFNQVFWVPKAFHI